MSVHWQNIKGVIHRFWKYTNKYYHFCCGKPVIKHWDNLGNKTQGLLINDAVDNVHSMNDLTTTFTESTYLYPIRHKGINHKLPKNLAHILCFYVVCYDLVPADFTNTLLCCSISMAIVQYVSQPDLKCDLHKMRSYFHKVTKILFRKTICSRLDRARSYLDCTLY